MIEVNQIYKKDCLIGMSNIPDMSIDMILCDPPYGTTACNWDSVIPLNEMWQNLNKVIKNNEAIALFAAQPFTSELIHSNIKNYKHYWVWDKEICGAFALAKKRPMVVTEEICVFTSGGSVKYYPIMEDAIPKNIRPINTGSSVSEATPVASGVAKSDKNYNPKKRYPKNIIKYSKYNAECNQLNRVHPTQKPVALLEYLIKTYTNEGDTVLDFTIGSGSTAIACINTKRKFIGFENDDIYYNLAKDRVNKHVLDQNMQDLYSIIS